MTASSSTASSSYEAIPTCMPSQKDPHWFFTKEQLDNSPSRRSGIDADKELFYRQQTASFIQEMGSKLQLPVYRTSTCICTAIVYAHRFYVFHSFQRFPRNDMAAAALFLAAKAQECPRKLEYVVKVSYALQHRDEPGLDTKSDKYLDEAQKIITYENILLQTIGFEIEVDLPHTHVVRYIQKVKGLTTPNKDLAQAAYFFATDILHVTTFCLRYRPSVIACVCIHLACNWAKWEIPEHEGRAWYYFVDPDITKETIEALSHEFTDVCAKSKERLKIQRYIGRRPFPAGANDGTAFNHDEPAPHGSNNFNPSPVPGHHRPVNSNPPPGVLGSSSAENKPRSHDPSFLSPSSSIKTEIKQEIKHETSLSPSVKKPKMEVLDLNRYKERREKEKETAAGASTSTSTASSDRGAQRDGHQSSSTSARKSFMPDVSKEAWPADFKDLHKPTSKIHLDNPPLPPPIKSEHRNPPPPPPPDTRHGGGSSAPDRRTPSSDHRQSSSADHRHGSGGPSSSEHRSSRPVPNDRGSSSTGDSRKRPAPASDPAGPPVKSVKVEQHRSDRDRDRERDPKAVDHHQHRSGQQKDGRPKEKPHSSSGNMVNCRLPPLPKPEANEEMNKAILNELGSSNPA